MKPLLFVAGLLLVLGALAAACGDDGDESDEDAIRNAVQEVVDPPSKTKNEDTVREVVDPPSKMKDDDIAKIRALASKYNLK